MSLTKHALYIRRVWIGGNADNMLKAVNSKDVDLYLSNRKKVVEQIQLFDEELKVTPLVNPLAIRKRCDWCEDTILSSCWPRPPEDLR